MKWPIVLVLGVALVALAVTVAAADPETPADRILKLFVDEFVPLTPGKDKFPATFRMGSAGDAPDSEKPAHDVTLRHPFAVARHEVTQELYETVMGVNPSKWKGKRNSVEMVTWTDAGDFCRKATTELRRRKLLAEGEVIRLPSEAEWEYTCRAGTKTAYSFGDKVEDLKDYAWFKDNSKGEDPPVGKKKANPWAWLICTATSGSGVRTPGTPTTRERRPTAAPGRTGTRRSTSSAAAPGRTTPRAAAAVSATTARPATRTTPSASAACGPKSHHKSTKGKRNEKSLPAPGFVFVLFVPLW
jgi:hypothetical protein